MSIISLLFYSQGLYTTPGHYHRSLGMALFAYGRKRDIIITCFYPWHTSYLDITDTVGVVNPFAKKFRNPIIERNACCIVIQVHFVSLICSIVFIVVIYRTNPIGLPIHKFIDIQIYNLPHIPRTSLCLKNNLSCNCCILPCNLHKIPNLYLLVYGILRCQR